MERTWRPIAAGILCIVVGAIAVVISGMAGISLVDPLMNSSSTIEAVILIYGEGIILIFVSLPSFGFGIFAIVCGICALRRRIWGLALTGSISALIFGIITNYMAFRVFGAWLSLVPSWLLLAFVISGILGLLALILVILGRREFG